MNFDQVTKSSIGIFSNPKMLVTVIGNFCLIIACIFTFQVGGIFFKYISGEGVEIPEMSLASNGDSSSGSKVGSISNFSIIKKRNIFGISQSKAAPKNNTPPAAAPPPKLNLRLVGTNTASKKSMFAIIEDKKKRDQDVFRIDEKIFSSGAILKEVETTNIKVSYHGKLQTIELEEGISSPSKSSKSTKNSFQNDSSGSDFTIDEDELTKALSNLPRLLSQARAVPFFRGGKSIGMRLFAIRRGSLYEKLGLKNGDILLSVNENSVADPTKAVKLFEELKSERSIQVAVERGGKQQELNYNVE